MLGSELDAASVAEVRLAASPLASVCKRWAWVDEAEPNDSKQVCVARKRGEPEDVDRRVHLPPGSFTSHDQRLSASEEMDDVIRS